MADPQTQIILDQLVAWLGEIRQADGYYTDAGRDVRTEQTRDSEPDAPCLYVFDDAASASQTGAYAAWTQNFTIEALVLDDGRGRAEARQVVSDIHRALHRQPHEWPLAGFVAALRETAREIPPRPQNSDWITPTVTLEVDYYDKEA